MADLVTLTIDDRQVEVPKGTLVVDAAAKLGIEIPIFCSHPKLDPVACCRMCLVEISGPRGMMLQTACSVPVAQDMVVKTNTQQVQDMQEANLAFLLLNHPLDCPICDKGGECPLQDQTLRFGPGISQLVEPKRQKKKHYMISDTIVLDQERCVLCWRCIRYLEEWEDRPQLALFERGGATIIDVQDGKPVDAKTSGNIIDICPVGALTNRVARFAFRPWEIERTPSICTQCAVGCNIRMDTRTHTLRRIISRENMQVNDQWICDKGRFNHGWVNHENRLTMPLVRKNGKLEPASWQEALGLVAEKLQGIKRAHGADAIGGIGSAKLSNESNYLLQRFMRQLVGTNNIDHRDGGDVSAIDVGLPALADLMKPQYGPDPKHDVVLLFGIDSNEELPVLDLHLKRSIRRGKLKVIVAHPRKTELMRYDAPHLQYTPGSEVLLLNALLAAAMAAKEDTKSEAAKTAGTVSEEQLRTVAGVEPQTVTQAAALLAGAQNALILYGPMVARGELGKAVTAGLTNLAQATGNYERLTYIGLEANSQGCRDLGVLPNRLPGHVAVDDALGKPLLEQMWGGSLPTVRGKTYTEMLDAAGGEIKALYIMGADPASERPTWAANLDQVDFLVVQELMLTETAQRADVVLPGLSWAEQDGTFTNLERRVQRAPKALGNPHTKAAPDWMILSHLATYFDAQWSYTAARAVTQEITKANPQYAGMTWERIGDQGQQWSLADAPYVRPEPTYTPVAQPALPPTDGGLRLVHSPALYDGGNLFMTTPQMVAMSFGLHAALNPVDAERLGLAAEDGVQVRNEHGTVRLAVKLEPAVKPGTVWIPASLQGAPVGALLNGGLEVVQVDKQS
jgi:NADH-quinone oxidoreductase chain G